MLTNRFASSALRLQHDRGQYVVTDGPYEMEVAYNGTDTAVISVGGTPVYSVNLDTAEITLITD